MWETAEPSGGSNAPDHIEISFNQDADFRGNALAYSNMLEPMIRNAYFNSGQQFGKVYTATWDSFTLWSAPEGAHRDSCDGGSTFNGLAKTAAAYTDGEVILHDDSTGGRQEPTENGD